MFGVYGTYGDTTNEANQQTEYCIRGPYCSELADSYRTRLYDSEYIDDPEIEDQPTLEDSGYVSGGSFHRQSKDKRKTTTITKKIRDLKDFHDNIAKNFIDEVEQRISLQYPNIHVDRDIISSYLFTERLNELHIENPYKCVGLSHMYVEPEVDCEGEICEKIDGGLTAGEIFDKTMTFTDSPNYRQYIKNWEESIEYC
jgi:hypothetical protein